MKPDRTVRLLLRAALAGVLLVSTHLASHAQLFRKIHAFHQPVTDGWYPRGGVVQAGDGKFYGVTNTGGAYGYGTLFSMDAAGSFTTLYSFDDRQGAIPNDPLILGQNGHLYGTTYGSFDDMPAANGSVFALDTATGNVATLHIFTGYNISSPADSEPAQPIGKLLRLPDGSLYGVSYYGGAFAEGTVYKIDPQGHLHVLHSFAGQPSDGSLPGAGLTLGKDGYLYGTTESGGAFGLGIVFRMDTAGNLTVLHHFASSEGSAANQLVQASDGFFYGTTGGSGLFGYGTAYKMDTSGHVTVLHNFDSAAPFSLIQASDGYFYGSIPDYQNSAGSLFRMDTAGNVTTLHVFQYTDGAGPFTLFQAQDGVLYGITSNGGVGYGTVFKITTAGQFTSLHSLNQDDTDGYFPFGGLTRASDGTIYGSTYLGGTANRGAIFRVDAANHLTFIHSFGYAMDAANPAGLIQGSDGNFYGTTLNGGDFGQGTFFTMDATGQATTLHSFAMADGSTPIAAPIEGKDGNFYGTLVGGGVNYSGAVYRINKQGQATILHTFNWAVDGGSPTYPLTQDADGALYGVTMQGGQYNLGTVFKIDANGVFSTLHVFNAAEGNWPMGKLCLARDGKLYGVTQKGGAFGMGTAFCMTTSGVLTTLHDFVGAEGAGDCGGLTQGNTPDDNFYASRQTGGINDYGTVFKMTPQGVVSVLHLFQNTDGRWPYGGVLLTPNGVLYGTANSGGTSTWNAGGSVYQIRLLRLLPVTPKKGIQ